MATIKNGKNTYLVQKIISLMLKRRKFITNATGSVTTASLIPTSLDTHLIYRK